MSTDTPTGFDRAPDRYTAKGRETIDRQRDAAHFLAALEIGRYAGPEDIHALADTLFAYHCHMCMMKYQDREGLKDDVDHEQAKAHFYSMMAQHVENPTVVPDPRSNRPDFKPYERPK